MKNTHKVARGRAKIERRPVAVARHETTVPDLLAAGRMEEVIERYEIMANSAATKAMRAHRASKTKYVPLPGMVKIKVSAQVAKFMHGLEPRPRRQLRLGIRSLPGDFKALKDESAAYWRLRIRSYRVILWRSATAIECIYAEYRGRIYDIFAESLRQKFTEK